MDSSSAPPPEWVLRLPTPLRTLLCFFLFSLLHTTDDSDTKLRKLFVGFLGFGSWQIVLLGVHGVANPEGGRRTFAVVYSNVALALAGLGMIAAFVVVKSAPHRATLACTIGFLAVIVPAFAMIPGAVTTPIWANFSIVAIAAVCADLPLSKLFIVLGAAGFLLSAYNHVLLVPLAPSGTSDAESHHQYMIVFPDPAYEFTVYRRALTMGTIFVNYCLVTLIVWIQRSESSRLTTEADATATLASALADALARYDTVQARASLKEARGTAVARIDLIERFEVIVANLDRYRPHLPNWVVATDSDEEEALADDGAHLNSTDRGKGPEGGSPSGSGVIQMSSLGSSGHDRPLSVSERGVLRRSDEIKKDAARSVGVAVAEVNYRLASPAGGSDVVVTGVAWEFPAEAGHRFVDRVHEVARQTGAAVHSFIGDVVHVTWNAASTVVQPEVKAARFLARLQADPGVEDGHRISVSGGAAAGVARVQLAGHGRQRAVLVSPREESCLRDAVTAGKARGCFVADESVYRGGQYAVEFAGVGVLRTAGAAAGGRGLYRVAGERLQHEAKDEEWLYAVARHGDAERSPNAARCEAVDRIVDGDIEAALDCLIRGGLVADDDQSRCGTAEELRARVLDAISTDFESMERAPPPVTRAPPTDYSIPPFAVHSSRKDGV